MSEWDTAQAMVRQIYPGLFLKDYLLEGEAGDNFFNGLTSDGRPRFQFQAGGTTLVSIVHEFGHAYEALVAYRGYHTLDSFRDRYWLWRQFGGDWQDDMYAGWAYLPGESIAETFMNSVYGRFIRDKSWDRQKPVTAYAARLFFQSVIGVDMTKWISPDMGVPTDANGNAATYVMPQGMAQGVPAFGVAQRIGITGAEPSLPNATFQVDTSGASALGRLIVRGDPVKNGTAYFRVMAIQ